MRVLLTGGGTGGHIYPALTLWNYILEKEANSEALYIGASGGLERDIVPRVGVPFVTIEAAGLKRQLSLGALKTVIKTYRGYRQARRQLKKYRPEVVVGTGGYVTLPVVFAARSLGIPAVIWEANARPGLTNVLCAKRSYGVAISFPDSEKYFKDAQRVVVTGNPRGCEVLNVPKTAQLEARNTYDIDPAKKLIVCFAGSRGAETVNQVFLETMGRFADKPGWQLLYVTGDKHYDYLKEQAHHVPSNVHLVPFIHNMPAVLPQASVVVTRAGGATLSEICALGLASILIPSPFVTANHQEENAKRLVERGAAKILLEKDLKPDTLWAALEDLLERGEGSKLREAARKMATPHAVETLYALVDEARKSRAK